LLNSARVNEENCPAIFKKWDKVWFQDCIAQGNRVPGHHAPCSPYIGMNILSVDPSTIICDSVQTPLIRELEKHHITCIPIQFRHAMALAGGIHCVTLDLRRQGVLEDYCS
jgi:N-dimethylarginine dimethylaminohydrolase